MARVVSQGSPAEAPPYPSDNCLSPDEGYCHADLNPFHVACSGWRSVRKVKGLKRLPWNQIRAVGVCLSKPWLRDLETVKPVARALGIADWLHMDTIELALTKPRLVHPRLTEKGPRRDRGLATGVNHASK